MSEVWKMPEGVQLTESPIYLNHGTATLNIRVSPDMTINGVPVKEVNIEKSDGTHIATVTVDGKLVVRQTYNILERKE